jgi:halocyanin-like protein
VTPKQNDLDTDIERRTVLRGVGSLAALGALAGCVDSATDGDGGRTTPTGTSSRGTPTQSPVDGDRISRRLEGWLEDVDNYRGLVDLRGRDSVTVGVGVRAHGGPFGFGPPAIRVDPGTTVVWEWVCDTGHNIVEQDGAFESGVKTRAGATFEQTFEEAGAVLYYCFPHQSLGMKGAVVVGDVSLDVDSAPAPTSDERPACEHESEPEPTPTETEPADPSTLREWLFDAHGSSVPNYDGPVDERGQDEVTITVGADGGDDAPFVFEPPVVRIDPGTTVVWTSAGRGTHIVASQSGTFHDNLTNDEGATFERTVDETGVVLYSCHPHATLGERGALIVGDADVDVPAPRTPTPDRREPLPTPADGPVVEGPPAVAEWLSETENYEGVVDLTGRDRVTVLVGFEGNGGNFTFSPPALRVDAGTTVVWEWTGKGGQHDVVTDGDRFRSPLQGERGATYERTLDEPGTILYRCRPHDALGMRGAIVVEESN